MENIFITYLSILPQRKDTPITYSAQTKKVADSFYTNEPGLIYIKNQLEEENKKIDKIIYICTNDVITQKNPLFMDMTSKEYFESCAKKTFPKAELTEVKLSDENNINVIFESLRNINGDSKIYLDITGGFRDAVYTLTLISRFLEFKGMNVEKVIYSRILKANGMITDYTDKFNLMDLINAISEFVSFGNSDSLLNFFEKSENPSVKNLIGSMKKFTDAITLGKIESLDFILEELLKNTQEFEKCTFSDTSEIILYELVPVIKNKFFGASGKTDYLSVISWCVENNLIQQALTVYTEKIPEVVFKNKILKKKENIETKLTSKTNPLFGNVYGSMLYTDLFEDVDIYSESKILGTIINAFHIGNANIRTKPTVEKALDRYKNIFAFTKSQPIRLLADKPIPKFWDSDTVNAWNILKSSTHIASLPSKVDIGKKFYDALLGFKEEKTPTIKRKVNFLKGYDKNIDRTAFVPADKNKFKRVIFDYVFFKAIRNEINHASSEENLDKECLEFFQGQGLIYKMDIATIRKELKSSVDYLKEIIEK